MHPDQYERRRALNIERFAAAREWDTVNICETPDQPALETTVSAFTFVSRAILVAVSLVAVVTGLILPALFSALGWENVLGVAAVLAVCAIAWAVDSREV